MLEVIFGVVCLAVVLVLIGTLSGVALINRNREKGRAEGAALLEDKESVLDALFDGSPVVAYESTIRTLPVPVVTEGAIARGYELMSNTAMAHGELINGRDLLFQKQNPAP